ncbi:hypothetical protein WG947_07825 [Pontibacter sp. H259]|uniref:hypothetical protein n=1 Tax=Pontibacter sp. H259 TaxID=3133421 RepID=UPI0030BA98AD
MTPLNRFLPRESAALVLQAIMSGKYSYQYEQEKHRLVFSEKAGTEEVYFRLPITLPAPGSNSNTKVHYVILLIQSGNCAVGYFENGINLNHKVFRSYMVRKKQGKSQIKYLKTKGKSRAGSRVRLGETLEFFEHINERLQGYFQRHEIHRVAISCSKTLLPYLYTSKVATPFDKHDPRLFKIPKHIHTPIYEVLLDANRFLLRGELIFDETTKPIVDELLETAGITSIVEEPEEDDTLETDEPEDELWDEDVDEDDEMEW